MPIFGMSEGGSMAPCPLNPFMIYLHDFKTDEGSARCNTATQCQQTHKAIEDSRLRPRAQRILRLHSQTPVVYGQAYGYGRRMSLSGRQYRGAELKR